MVTCRKKDETKLHRRKKHCKSERPNCPYHNWNRVVLCATATHNMLVTLVRGQQIENMSTKERSRERAEPRETAMSNCLRRVMTTPALLLLLALCTVMIILVITIVCVREDSWGPYANAPKVMIQQGALRGIYSLTRKGNNIVSFLGVPYASPPIGELRFKAPQPPAPWLGTRDATEDASMCLQLSPTGIVGQEDCLYLNVHTPKLPNELSPLLPVMVWIHGGGFYMGTGNSKFWKPTYLLDHNVVLVTLNYRLGPLGFLSTGDEVLPGNYGMKDQVAALVWVHDNIEEFGGNPNSVTLFGGSVGGASVHYHMLSPMSQGLFHRGISQSGTAVGSFVLVPRETARSRAMKVASLLGCGGSPTTELVTCLRSKNATAITITISQIDNWDGVPIATFPPVVEHSGTDRFLPDVPLNILKANKFESVPWLTGINAQDGSFIAGSIYADSNKIAQLDRDFNHITVKTMYLRGQEKASNVTDMIRKFYFGNRHIDNATVSEVVNMYTDGYFTYPLNQSVTLHVAVGNRKVYVYYFTYVRSSSNSVFYGENGHNYGSCHGDEILYLFPSHEILPNFTLNKYDLKMVDIMTTLWTNFARTGNPTDQVGMLIPVAWDPVTAQAGNYLEIGAHLYRRTNLLPSHVRLWHTVFHWA